MMSLSLPPGGTATAYIWWVFGRSYKEVAALANLKRVLESK